MPLIPQPISNLPAGSPSQDDVAIVENTAGTELKVTLGQILAMMGVPVDIMLKSVYDTNGDGVVNDSALLEGQNGAYYRSRANHTGSQATSTITGLDAALAALIPLAQKAAANGVATLDGTGKIPAAQLPFVVFSFLGVWDANTNTPTLADGTGSNSQMYIVNVAGNQDLGSGVIAFNIADLLIHDGSAWKLIPTSTVVVLGVTDITTQILAGATGSVTIDDTSHFNDVAGKRFMTESQYDAMNAAAAPSGANPLATLNDVNAVAVTGSYPPSPDDVPDPIVSPLHADITFATAGITQPQIDAAYGGGFATTADNVDWAAMKYRMLQAVNNGTPMSLVGNYYMGSNDLVMPLTFPSNFFELHGYGNKIFFNAGKGWTRTRPISLGESQSQQNDQFFIYDVKFYGSGAGIGFAPAANSNSVFHKLFIKDFATAAIFRTTQNAMITSIDVHDCYDGVYVQTEENAPGWGVPASLATVQSNGTRMYQPRFRHSVDAGTAITYLGSYGGEVHGAQIEGNGSIDRGIVFDGQSLTTVSRFMVVDPHFESTDGFRSSAIYCRMRQGVFDLVSPEHDIATTVSGTGDNLLMVEGVSTIFSPSLIINITGINKWDPAVNGSYPNKWFKNSDCRWMFNLWSSEVPPYTSKFAGTAVTETAKLSNVTGNNYSYI